MLGVQRGARLGPAGAENRERAYLPEKTWDKLLGELERED
jgi:hypothetical protein